MRRRRTVPRAGTIDARHRNGCAGVHRKGPPRGPFISLRQSTEALEDCNEALRLLPDQPEVLDSRALALWQLGEDAKARADLARARAIDPALPSPDERLRQFEDMFE